MNYVFIYGFNKLLYSVGQCAHTRETKQTKRENETQTKYTPTRLGDDDETLIAVKRGGKTVVGERCVFRNKRSKFACGLGIYILCIERKYDEY